MLRFFLLSVLLTPIICYRVAQHSNELLDQLLERSRYDARVIPGNYSSDSVATIRTNFFIRAIDYICTKSMHVKMQITFRQQWNDPRLTYTSRMGLQYLVLDNEDRIWTPDTFFTNSWQTERMTDLRENLLIRIYPNGNVLQSVRLKLLLSCPMGLYYYPLDVQDCSVQMASYGYTTSDIVLLWKELDPIQMTKSLLLEDFTFIKQVTSYCTSRTMTGEYSCLKVDLLFKRNYFRYICQWFVPTAALTFISFVSFWLKPKSTRTQLLSVTLLLLYVNTIYISNKSSATRSYTSAIDRWLAVCLGFVLAAFLELALVVGVDSFLRRNKQTSPHNHQDEADVKKTLKEDTDSSIESKFLLQSWKQSSVSRRIDFCCGLLFPAFFILYIIFVFLQRTLFLNDIDVTNN